MYLNKVFQSVDIQSTFKDCWLVKEPSLHNCLYRVIVTVQIQPQGYRLYSDFKLMNVWLPVTDSLGQLLSTFYASSVRIAKEVRMCFWINSILCWFQKNHL